MNEDVVEKSVAHIRGCDEIFDGNVVRQDREFAYNQLRVLTFELLDIHEDLVRERDFYRRRWYFHGIRWPTWGQWPANMFAAFNEARRRGV